MTREKRHNILIGVLADWGDQHILAELHLTTTDKSFLTKEAERATQLTAHIAALKATLESEAKLLEACNEISAGPVDEPQIELSGEYETGLFCGLEDRDLQGTGYEACRYGFEVGVERGLEWAQGIILAAVAEADPLELPAEGEAGQRP
jgi:hypothetical protein